jgi:hypothetical protein
MIQRDSRIIAAGEGEVVSCHIAGEAALLNLKSEAYYGLDKVGAVVWSLLEQPRTVEEITTALLQRFDVEPQRCEQDLLALLNQMEQANLVRPCPDGQEVAPSACA